MLNSGFEHFAEALVFAHGRFAPPKRRNTRTWPSDRRRRSCGHLAAASEIPRGPKTRRVIVDMRQACAHAWRMNKMLQVRNLKAEIHKKAKIRAAMEGKTLMDWAAALIEREVSRPTHAEISERLRRLPALEHLAVIREEIILENVIAGDCRRCLGAAGLG